MAGKNQVTLTFAGDSDKLEKSMASVGSSSRQLEGDLDRVGSSVTRVDKVTGQGGRQFGDYGTGLGGMGDRADEADTRMMGLSDGIQGVTDLMGGNGKLAPHEMAMAFSDLGSAAYNTVIPSMQSVVKATKGMNLAMAASVVGLVALAAGAAYLAFTQESAVHNSDELTASLKSQDAGVQESGRQWIKYLDATGSLQENFDKVLEQTPQMADEWIELARSSGVAREDIVEMEAKLGEVAETSDYAADSIRGISDALMAQVDPVFAVLDAQNQMRDSNIAVTEAQTGVNEAMAEFGVGSPEAVAAEQALTDAHLAAAQAAFGQDSALFNLAAEMKAQGFAVDDVIAHLQGMVGQNGVTQGSVDAVAAAMRGIPGQISATVDVDVNRAELDRLLSVGTFGLFQPRVRMHSGGIVPGAPGSETLALLQAGERVTPANRSGGGGGPVVNLYVQGSIRSDRDLVKIIRDELGRGGLRT
jgi:hypothetical protein